MYPSQVRSRVIEVHQALRERLDRVAALADEVLKGERRPDRLRDELAALSDSLADHDALEDEILAPVLRESDAFGDVRARLLRQHHAAQRREIDEGLAHLANAHTDLGAIALFARQMVAALRADMDEEERTLLDPGVVRDDTVTIAPSA